MATKLRINELSSRLSQLKRKDEKKEEVSTNNDSKEISENLTNLSAERV